MFSVEEFSKENIHKLCSRFSAEKIVVCKIYGNAHETFFSRNARPEVLNVLSEVFLSTIYVGKSRSFIFMNIAIGRICVQSIAMNLIIQELKTSHMFLALNVTHGRTEEQQYMWSSLTLNFTSFIKILSLDVMSLDN